MKKNYQTTSPRNISLQASCLSGGLLKQTQETWILFPPLPSPSSKSLNKCCFFGSSFAGASSQTVPLLLGAGWGEAEDMTPPAHASMGARDTSRESAGSHWRTAISTGHVLMLASTLGNYTQNLPISCLIAQAQTFAPPPKTAKTYQWHLHYLQAALPVLA